MDSIGGRPLLFSYYWNRLIIQTAATPKMMSPAKRHDKNDLFTVTSLVATVLLPPFQGEYDRSHHRVFRRGCRKKRIQGAPNLGRGASANTGELLGKWDRAKRFEWHQDALRRGGRTVAATKTAPLPPVAGGADLAKVRPTRSDEFLQLVGEDTPGIPVAEGAARPRSWGSIAKTTSTGCATTSRSKSRAIKKGSGRGYATKASSR